MSSLAEKGMALVVGANKGIGLGVGRTTLCRGTCAICVSANHHHTTTCSCCPCKQYVKHALGQGSGVTSQQRQQHLVDVVTIVLRTNKVLIMFFFDSCAGC